MSHHDKKCHFQSFLSKRISSIIYWDGSFYPYFSPYPYHYFTLLCLMKWIMASHSSFPNEKKKNRENTIILKWPLCIGDVIIIVNTILSGDDSWIQMASGWEVSCCLHVSQTAPFGPSSLGVSNIIVDQSESPHAMDLSPCCLH